MEKAERSGLTLPAFLAAVLLASCAGPDATAQAENKLPGSQAGRIGDIDPAPNLNCCNELEPVDLPPLVVLPESYVAMDEPAVPPPPFIACAGPATQGGAIVCRANPGGTILLDGKPVAIAGDDGVAIIGLRRDAPKEVRIGARIAGSEYEAAATVEVLSRTDAVSKFSMECNKIAAQSPQEKRHAEVSWVKKDKALKMFAPPVSGLGFLKPAEGPYSSPFGAVRTYVPKTKDCEGSTNVHNGQDIAIPTGTEILAPMGGTVLLADPDLYYEGGAVFLDHGHGLVSVMMHMSRIDVADGQVVGQGDVLGLSGATGRVTGPHLHWAIKYRNVHSDDRGTDIWLDPVLMMEMSLPQ